jgi:EpsI family protein
VSLLTVGIVFANVADTRAWMRIAIAASAIPTAIVSNGLRIAGTAVAAHYYGAAAAEGFFHEFSGWVLFGVAVAAMLLLHRALTFLAPDRAQAHGWVASAPIVGASTRAESAGILRAATVFSLLIAGSAVVAAVETTDRIPARQPLAVFPTTLGAWRGYDDPPLAEDVRAVLNADDLLMRTYFAPEGTAAGLYIGYWETQRRGDAVHSPLNCLPGSGWQPLSKRLLTIDAADSPDAPPIQVNRYVIQKGSERLLVLYWYQGHGRIVASEYAGKFFLVADAIRMRRSDTAIVRISTPIAGSDAAAEARAERGATEFARRLLRELDAHIPL